MKPGLLLKQYHPKSPRVGTPGNSGPFTTILGIGPTGKWFFLLRTDLPQEEDTSCEVELVDAPFEYECLDEPSEDEEDVPPEVKLVLVEATSASGFDELRAEQRLPCAPSANNSSEISQIISYGDLPRVTDLYLRAENARGGGIFTTRPRRSAWLKKRHDVRDLFGFPILIFWGNACNYRTINQGQEGRVLGMAALYLGAGLSFRNVPIGRTR
ncbi:hypothetical protein Cgig2_021807 [Carnegiea gigantea]|uniref:Uncharacterized protein n=1 Tax=Carnegiea gigantea TaxID=171969 RepID=A0A9Q1QEH7_9CARY|nr:hypothetical protein Cgig2_021807 [Carnegiea gigantea]